MKEENIDINILHKKIQKQFKKIDENNKIISLSNKMLIIEPIVYVGILLLTYITTIGKFDDFTSYIYNFGGLSFITTTLLAGSTVTFFGITKIINKKKNKRLNEELNKNLSIQKQLEFNKGNSIELTDIKVKEDSLNTIKEIELPEIYIANNNIKNKPKTRILKKDN